ncbi:MAG: hypothetical protein ABR515_08710, partial [Nitrososphaeraceae archaeon]
WELKLIPILSFKITVFGLAGMEEILLIYMDHDILISGFQNLNKKKPADIYYYSAPACFRGGMDFMHIRN